MLAKKSIPKEYLQWNNKWKAPFGNPFIKYVPDFLKRGKIYRRFAGPFAFQPHNKNRSYEYPWAFFSANIKKGMKVIEFGGGLSGFQFVLDKSGANVCNIDPGMRAKGRGWEVSKDSIDSLNNIFNTHVKLCNCFIEEANLKSNHYDIVFSISVLEHLSRAEICTALNHIRRILKKGGLCILTIDLFMNIHPFSKIKKNEYGSNLSIKELIEISKLKMIYGKKDELYGFEEFDFKAIQKNANRYLLENNNLSLVQTLILQK